LCSNLPPPPMCSSAAKDQWWARLRAAGMPMCCPRCCAGMHLSARPAGTARAAGAQSVAGAQVHAGRQGPADRPGRAAGGADGLPAAASRAYDPVHDAGAGRRAVQGPRLRAPARAPGGRRHCAAPAAHAAVRCAHCRLLAGPPLCTLCCSDMPITVLTLAKSCRDHRHPCLCSQTLRTADGEGGTNNSLCWAYANGHGRFALQLPGRMPSTRCNHTCQLPARSMLGLYTMP